MNNYQYNVRNSQTLPLVSSAVQNLQLTGGSKQYAVLSFTDNVNIDCGLPCPNVVQVINGENLGFGHSNLPGLSQTHLYFVA